MLTLVLAEAELEPIPPELCRHPAVIAHARRRGKQPQQILLDSNYDHAALTTLLEGRRRGRPDITHLFLLTALESIVNKQGQLRILIHTRNDQVITISPQTRIMRNYERFLGMMEQLFEKTVVPDANHPLLVLEQHMTLTQVVEKQKADSVVVFSKEGMQIKLHEYFRKLTKQKKSDLLCIIGGFPSGSFHTDMNTIATAVVSLYPEMLPAWTVAGEILVNYGNMCR